MLLFFYCHIIRCFVSGEKQSKKNCVQQIKMLVKSPPLVTGVSPKEGPPGTRITIRGENLGTDPKDLIGNLFLALFIDTSINLVTMFSFSHLFV